MAAGTGRAAALFALLVLAGPPARGAGSLAALRGLEEGAAQAARYDGAKSEPEPLIIAPEEPVPGAEKDSRTPRRTRVAPPDPRKEVPEDIAPQKPAKEKWKGALMTIGGLVAAGGFLASMAGAAYLTIAGGGALLFLIGALL